MPWKCHKVFGGVLTAWVLARAHSLVFGFAQTAWRILKPQQADMNNDDRTGIETESHKVRWTLKSIVGCRFFFWVAFFVLMELGYTGIPQKRFLQLQRAQRFQLSDWASLQDHRRSCKNSTANQQPRWHQLHSQLYHWQHTKRSTKFNFSFTHLCTIQLSKSFKVHLFIFHFQTKHRS
jgi:hypothetical protein